MRLTSFFILFFIINNICYCQEFTLITQPTNPETKKIIDSLRITSNHSDYKSIKSTLEKLSQDLDKLGYFEKTISSPTKVSDSTFNTKIELGNRYEKIIIHFSNEENLSSIIKKISPTTNNTVTLKPEKVEEFLEKILKEYNKKGYAFAIVQLKNLKKLNNKQFKGELNITTNNVRTIDNIIIKGYEKFPKTYLKHLYHIKLGSKLDIATIKRKTNSFKQTPFTSEIKPPEILFTKDSTVLYFYLKKENSNYLDGFLGFSNTETENKLRLNGYLKLDLLNNLNSGEKLSILYRSTENDQRTFRGRLNIPYLFKSPIGIEAGLEIFKQDTSFINSNQRINVNYQLNQNISLSTGYFYENSNKLESTDISIEDYSVNSISLGVNFSLNNNFEFRTSNIIINTAFGNRKTDTKEKQTQWEIEASKSFLLNERNIIFIKNNNYLLSTESPLKNQLFRLGGIKSIRGFEEQSIPASLASILNTEYIYVLGQSMNIHSIIDIGYIKNQTVKSSEKLISFGFGLDFIRKSNRLSLIFANGKTSNSNFNFSNSKVHISLTTRF